MSKKTGDRQGGKTSSGWTKANRRVSRNIADGFFVKSDEVAAEGAKLQPKEVFRGALIHKHITSFGIIETVEKGFFSRVRKYEK